MHRYKMTDPKHHDMEENDTMENDAEMDVYTREPEDDPPYEIDSDREEIVDFFFRFRKELETRHIDHVFADQIRSSLEFHLFVQRYGGR